MTPKDPREQALTALRTAHTAVKNAVQDAEATRVAAVAAARQAGVTWDAIADAVEQAQPNAWKKYAPLIQEETTTVVTVRPPGRR